MYTVYSINWLTSMNRNTQRFHSNDDMLWKPNVYSAHTNL